MLLETLMPIYRSARLGILFQGSLLRHSWQSEGDDDSNTWLPTTHVGDPN